MLTRLAQARPTGLARACFAARVPIHQQANRIAQSGAHGDTSHATGSNDHWPYLRATYNRPMARDAYYGSNAGANQRSRCFNGYRSDRMGHKPLVMI